MFIYVFCYTTLSHTQNLPSQAKHIMQSKEATVWSNSESIPPERQQDPNLDRAGGVGRGAKGKFWPGEGAGKGGGGCRQILLFVGKQPVLLSF